MDARKKLFYACALAVVLTLAVAGIAHYGFGLERESMFLVTFAIGFAAFGATTTLAALGFAALGFAALAALTAIVALAVFAAAAVGFAAATAVVIFAAIGFAALAGDYRIPFPRVFGCLWAEIGAISLGLYFLPDPLKVIIAGGAGIVLMLVFLYLPCPRFLHRRPSVPDWSTWR